MTVVLAVTTVATLVGLSEVLSHDWPDIHQGVLTFIGAVVLTYAILAKTTLAA